MPKIAVRVQDVDVADRTVTLEVDTEARTEELKGLVGAEWREWRGMELVLLRDADRQEVPDRITLAAAGVADGALLLAVARTTLAEAAAKNKTRTAKQEEEDEERWGQFAKQEGKKVGVQIAQNDAGMLSARLTWTDEGHTLGNALRHALVQNASVLQCGYSIPHPLENKMVMEITSKAYPPDLVRHSLESLADLCDTSASVFAAAVEDFDSQMEIEG